MGCRFWEIRAPSLKGGRKSGNGSREAAALAALLLEQKQKFFEQRRLLAGRADPKTLERVAAAHIGEMARSIAMKMQERFGLQIEGFGFLN